jgi:glycosyltransferase involved in cell wall biosynthesis
MTLHRLAAGLAARGHAIEVVRPRQSPDDVSTPGAGFTEWLVPGLPLPGYPGLHFGLPAAARLRRRWRAARPDFVHIATEGPLGWSALNAARGLGLTAVSSFHTNFHTYGRHYGVGFARRVGLAYLRRLHNRTACTFAPAADLIATLGAAGFRNLHLLGRGVDTTLFTPARRDDALRASWGAGPETPVAMCVGRLAAEKNLALVAAAWESLRLSLPGVRLVLVGDGPLRRELMRRNPEIHFAGLRRGEDLARHYASGDLFLFASVTETFGNVVTEALASGLVVVAYDYAAARAHVRDGVSGYLSTFDDPAAFQAAAARAASARATWPAIRAAARAAARELSWERIVAGYEDALANLPATPARPAPVTAALRDVTDG